MTAHFGFMQRPDIPAPAADEAQQRGCDVRLDDVTYYVGHEIILHRERGADCRHWQEAMFAAMVRNASHVTDYFRLPSEQVVEIGRQISSLKAISVPAMLSFVFTLRPAMLSRLRRNCVPRKLNARAME